MSHPSVALTAPSALEALDVAVVFRRHGRDIGRWASRLGGPLVDSDDVVQEVLAVVHRRLDAFQPGTSLRAWLYAITQNIATTLRRRERLRRWLCGCPDDYAQDVASQRASIVDELERREAALDVYAALDRLDEKYRSTVILFELEGLSGEEIAVLTGRPLATVWIHLHRGRRKFREQYAKLLKKRSPP